MLIGGDGDAQFEQQPGDGERLLLLSTQSSCRDIAAPRQWLWVGQVRPISSRAALKPLSKSQPQNEWMPLAGFTYSMETSIGCLY